MPGHKLDRFVFSFAPRSSPSLRRLLIYGVAARQCAKNRLPPIAAGRIQRNRVGVSWHTTLLAKSSVLYLCKGEGSTDSLRAPHLSSKDSRTQAGRWCKLHLSASLFALCGTKVYKAPPQRPCYCCIKVVFCPASHVSLCRGCYTLPSCRFAAIGAFPRLSVFHN